MNKIIIDNLPVPRIDDNGFSTEHFLHDIYRSMHNELNDEQFKIIDRICKKIDVVKKVSVFYNPDLSKSILDIPIHHKYSIVLIDVLLHYAKILNDFKFLNSAMKLFDLIQKDICKEAQELIEKRYVYLLNKLADLL